MSEPLPSDQAGASTRAPASARRRLLAAGPLALLLGRAELAFGAAIVGVRIWPARDYTRVTIESDQPLAARHSLVENPPRLVVDIDGLGLDTALRELVGRVVPSDPYIAGLRVGQFQPRVVRLVFDLKQAVAPQQFALAPVATYRHRLVLDLYPAQPGAEHDPLLALLREKEAAQAAGAATGPSAATVPSQHPAPHPAPQSTPQPAPVSAPQPAPLPAVQPAPSSGSAGQSTDASDRPTPAASEPPVASPPAPPSGVSAADLQRIKRLVVVAIDPGHGGEDPGAIGPTGLREKDVVLHVAKLLRERLNAVDGLRAMLTRDADFFVPLRERVAKARRVHADLFVSIHADAAPRTSAQGASVFALSTSGATSTLARWMADRENAADVVGGVNVAVQDAQVMRTLLDMSTTAQIRDSLKLGRHVLARMARVGSLHKPQVEQAGFAVLKAPDIPSILVETAFISNPEEEQKLRDSAYRRQLADAIAAGIQRWLATRPALSRQRQA